MNTTHKNYDTRQRVQQQPSGHEIELNIDVHGSMVNKWRVQWSPQKEKSPDDGPCEAETCRKTKKIRVISEILIITFNV
jgi:hypothetical protein